MEVKENETPSVEREKYTLKLKKSVKCATLRVKVATLGAGLLPHC